MQITAKDVTGGSIETTKEDPKESPVNPIPNQQSQEEAARFAQLAKREKIIRHKAREIETAKASYEAQKAELEQIKQEAASLKAWKEQVLNQPVHTLHQEGVTSDQLTQMLLNQPDFTAQEIVKMQAKLKTIEDNQNQSLKKIEENQTQSYQQAVKQMTNEVKMLVQGSDDYETIKNMNAEDSVVELITAEFEASGILMPVDEAAREVEEYLVEEALKLARLKKIQGKLTTMQDLPIAKPQEPASKTLSHTSQQSSKPLTSKERRERAIAAFQGKLA